MMKRIKFYWETLKETFTQWNNSSASNDSASLAYYAIFSIPGLLIIIIWIAGHFFGEEAIRGEISNQISGIMGQDVAKSIQDMIAGALIDKENIIMKIIGIGSLVFGSTTLFFQLQHSLNNLWEVKAAPKKAFVKFLIDRANSLGLILIIGFLLMITMLLSSVISIFNNWITAYFGLETYILVQLINFSVGFLITMLLFALMFKFFPDIRIRWKPVWNGAFLTAVLFTLGKFFLSLYFSKAQPTSAFGAAGTVILIMMWINYSCMLIFFGAEYTKVYAQRKGFKVIPSPHATWNEAKMYEDSVKEKNESEKSSTMNSQ